MSTKLSRIELLHDEGYGDDLLWHINTALSGKDMRAERIIAADTESQGCECLADCGQILEYQPEAFWMRKDYIYNAATAMATLISYVRTMQTDVPRFREQLDRDIATAESALAIMRESCKQVGT